MFHPLLLVLLLPATFDATPQTPKECSSDMYTSFLDVALDMITKARTDFPKCSSEEESKPMDCEAVLRSGRNTSGVYSVWPRSRVSGSGPLDVYCDMDTEGGGWTVVQRRGDFSRPKDFFFQDWEAYRAGFGDIEKDFWLGNDNLFALTNQRLNSIRFDLKAVDGEKRFALYDSFWIDDENNNYTIHIKGYSGDAGDSMNVKHDNQRFSTKDRDNDNLKDASCSQAYKGGWWYNACHDSNLNGRYLRGVHETHADGVNWKLFRGHKESLDTSEMKIRPQAFRRTKTSNKP